MPPTNVPTIGSISERRKSMSRSISDCCVAPSAAMKNDADSATSSGLASGSPYSDGDRPGEQRRRGRVKSDAAADRDPERRVAVDLG